MRRVHVISARAHIHSYSADRDRCSRGIFKVMASCPSTDRGKMAKRKRVVLSISDCSVRVYIMNLHVCACANHSAAYV